MEHFKTAILANSSKRMFLNLRGCILREIAEGMFHQLIYKNLLGAK